MSTERKKDIISLYGHEHFNTWFEKVYEDNFEILFRYAYSITKDKPLAEDVVSEVFTVVWNKKPHSSSIEELNSYIFISVKRLAIQLVKKKKKRGISNTTFDPTLQLNDCVNPENLLLGKELDSVIKTIVDDFPSHTFLVYDMIMSKGLSHEEIANELGISKRTVEKHMSNALKKIRTGLQKHFQHDEVTFNYIDQVSSFALVAFLCGVQPYV